MHLPRATDASGQGRYFSCTIPCHSPPPEPPRSKVLFLAVSSFKQGTLLLGGTSRLIHEFAIPIAPFLVTVINNRSIEIRYCRMRFQERYQYDVGAWVVNNRYQ